MKHDSLINMLKERFGVAVAAVAGTKPGEIDPVVRPAGDPRFGDYQCNVAMSLAKRLKAKPRDIAQRIVEAVELTGVAEPPEIAGPGFINVRLLDKFLADYLGEVPAPPQSEPGASATGQSEPEASATAQSEPEAQARAPKTTSQKPTPQEADRLGMPPVERPRKVLVDYSSPNIAKQMHVGHLRSTVIGDVFARVLGFDGHKVVRQNHIGNWGRQFGRIILGLWHICMAKKRGEPDYINQKMLELQETQETQEQGEDAEKTILNTIVETHNRDLDQDSDGQRVFKRFLEEALKGEISLDELETAYQFVSLVEELAPGKGLFTYNYRDNKKRIPYEHLSRYITAMLQKGSQENEQENIACEDACKISLDYCDRIYRRLGVLLERADVCGESFYNDRLVPLVTELREKLPPRDKAVPAGVPYAELREDAGAQCVFLYDEKHKPLFKKQDGDELPMMVQKSDGAFLYATTDLAAIWYRIKKLGCKRLVYVTDARQKLHFEMLFATARAVGWAGDDVSLEHASFGSVLGANRKPLKTREGENVKLGELLDEAEKLARELLDARSDEATERRGGGEYDGPVSFFSEEEKCEIARRVGIASVKYADLRNDRVSDYVFNWDKMLAMQGNTAPYMMYAYARIRSIYRKAAERFGKPDVYADDVAISLNEPAERALALRLGRLRETIDAVAAELAPHVLCTYLYDLASDFMRFYESCPVLKAADETSRLSRMRLCDLTARALKLGLGLLGIETIERM